MAGLGCQQAMYAAQILIERSSAVDRISRQLDRQLATFEVCTCRRKGRPLRNCQRTNLYTHGWRDERRLEIDLRRTRRNTSSTRLTRVLR